MSLSDPTAAPAERPLAARRARRALLWAALVALLLVAQTMLVVLTLRDESNRRQEDAEAAALEAAAEARRELMAAVQSLQGLTLAAAPLPGGPSLDELMRARRSLLRVERRDADRRIVAEADSALAPPLFAQLPRADLQGDAVIACAIAHADSVPVFSRSYYVPLAGGQGLEATDLCLPLREAGRDAGFLVATFSLRHLLEGIAALPVVRGYELSIVEADGTRLARAGAGRGSGLFVGERAIDLPGTTLQLRANSHRGQPSLIPNLATALVLGLSATLLALVFVLARDGRLRAQAEAALAEALALRKAMGDSLSTGLRARDLEGRITYVNPAFCNMVGFAADELQGPVPPYWPPEQLEAYLQRRRAHLDAGSVRDGEAREGFETVFMNKSGERFPVMIYEAPLVDGQGRHAGWMSAVVDLSSQRRSEEIARQQQDRLQATARLATVGEMASLLSHELNQPLAAIASYAAGSLNLLATDDDEQRATIGQALARIAEQAERAGRVIKSVNDFVRRREQHLETVNVELLLQSVLPLVRLQARKSGTRVEVDLPERAPSVVGDRTMLEQVLLNLTRNGIQAMEGDMPPAERLLTLRVRQTHERWVTFSVVDAGPGIAAEVAKRLFTPFFTTRSEGMGIGLSLCRTVIEQHGGALDFTTPVAAGRGTEFRFTLATPRAPAGAGSAARNTA